MINEPIFCWDNDGTLDIFATQKQAELYHEPWILERGFEAFDSRGFRLKAYPHKQEYCIVLTEFPEEEQDGAKRLHGLLVNSFEYADNRPKDWHFLQLTDMIDWCVANIDKIATR